MAKRFIDTDFFKDPFVRGLKGAFKGLYVYLFLDCSNGGIWNVEIDVAKIRCGIEPDVSEEEIKEVFSEKIIELDNGEKWFLKNFVKFQHKGVLKENNKAHISAINELLSYALIEEKNDGIFEVKEEKNKGHQSPLEGAKVIVKVKEKVKAKVKEKEKKEISKIEKSEPELKIPWETENFRVQWQHWKIYKKKEFGFNFKSAQSEQASLTELANKAGGNEKTAIAIMHQSMANGWKGFFELKQNQNGNRGNNFTKSDSEIKQSISDTVDRMLGE